MLRRWNAMILLLGLGVACAGDSTGDEDTSGTGVTTNASATLGTTAGSTSATSGSTTGDETSTSASTTDATSSTATSTASTTTDASTTATTDATTDATTAGTTAVTDSTTSTTGDSTSTTGDTGDGLFPPAGDSSHGAGGGPASGTMRVTTMGGITYRVIAPSLPGPLPAMIVYSGVEGGQVMTQNLLMTKDFTGLDNVIFGVIDGADYYGDGMAGAYVLDELREDYDVDNDRTYLLSESAGTSAGLKLGLTLRQSYFAAYWANDVNAALTPTLSAAELGFAPFGNAGPGGAYAQADAIVAGMQAQGYQTPPPAPYDGPGADKHGDTQQFLAALQWFPGRSRF